MDRLKPVMLKLFPSMTRDELEADLEFVRQCSADGSLEGRNPASVLGAVRTLLCFRNGARRGEHCMACGRAYGARGTVRLACACVLHASCWSVWGSVCGSCPECGARG